MPIRAYISLVLLILPFVQGASALGIWQLGADIDGEAAGDHSGWSVSLSADGNRLAIGAEGNDGSDTDAGHTRVYEYSNEAWAQLGADIDGEAAGDRSGGSVSLSADGNRLAIGAHQNDGSGTDAGHTRVYEYSNGAWAQLGADIDGEAAGDHSGWSVSLSADGNRLAIGAHQNDGSGTDAGHTRVYEYSNGAWAQLGADIDGEAAGDRSGNSVSLSADGNRLAIGAHQNDGSGTGAYGPYGHTRVYEYSNGVWAQVGADIDGEAAGDRSGWSVSLSADGNRLAIGAYQNDGMQKSNAGHTRVYEYSNGAWAQLGADIDGEAPADGSGYSVSLSADGNRLAIGDNFGYGLNDPSGSGADAIHTRVYEYCNGAWAQLGSDIDGEAAWDQSGYSVSLSADGNRLAIGAIGNDGSGTSAGHTRVYQIGASAGQLGVDIDGEAAGDHSGWSVSLSADGNRLAIGAEGNDRWGTDTGHTRVYEYSNEAWAQLGADIDGEAAGDRSGGSVSLSADGNRLAIGAHQNDGSGTDAGHTRVYEYSNGAWAQLGADIDGEAAGDHSGWSVSLSADGNRLAIGAHQNDRWGTDTGHTRVYEYSNEAWAQLGADIDGEAAGDRSGGSVSLSADGNRLAIGAHQNDGSGTDAGHTRVYEYSDGVWAQVGADIDGEAAGDRSGWSVSLSADGNRLAIGAYQNDGMQKSNAGHTRVYEYSNGAWAQLGADIDGEAPADGSGYSVSLSADGNRLAIGDNFGYGLNDPSGSGADAIHTRVYEYCNGANWAQLGSDIDGEAAWDQSGYSVSLSADGNRLAIGAIGNDGSGTSAGHTRVYQIGALCVVCVVGVSDTVNSCTLPVGTLSDGTNCNTGEVGCTVAVLDGATELTCAAGYGGIPAKANAACNTDGGTFTGAIFCTAHSCTCTGGTAAVAVDGTCNVDGAEDCTACNTGYTLNGQVCNAHSCTCTGGTAAVAVDGSCNVDGAEDCTACNTGYTLNGQVCNAHSCTCTGGTAAVAVDGTCNVDGAEDCTACNTGYTLNGQVCNAHSCTCTGGTAAVAVDGTCNVDGAEDCTACNTGYTLNGQVCNAHSCTCTGGTAAVAVDGSCNVDGAEDCTACNTGYTLNGQVCNAHSCTCTGGTAAVAVDGSCNVDGAEDCTACNTGYTLNGQVCNAHSCTCTGGTAAVAVDGSCDVDGAEDCTACNTGYTLNGQVCNVIVERFYLGKGGTECPPGDLIPDVETCRVAHDALRISRSDEWTGTNGNIPAACGSRPTMFPNFHWNKATNGGPQSDVKPVCQVNSLLSLGKTSYTVQEDIVVTFQRGAGATATDWIAVYPSSVAAPDSRRQATLWLYVCNSQKACRSPVSTGVINFGPLQPNEYYLWYFTEDGYAPVVTTPASPVRFKVVKSVLLGAADESAAANCHPNVLLLVATCLTFVLVMRA